MGPQQQLGTGTSGPRGLKPLGVAAKPLRLLATLILGTSQVEEGREQVWLLLRTPPHPTPGCERDRLSFGFCETLRLLGRCQLPAVRTQCCRSCPLPGHGVPSRGHQRVARR